MTYSYVKLNLDLLSIMSGFVDGKKDGSNWTSQSGPPNYLQANEYILCIINIYTIKYIIKIHQEKITSQKC